MTWIMLAIIGAMLPPFLAALVLEQRRCRLLSAYLYGVQAGLFIAMVILMIAEWV